MLLPFTVAFLFGLVLGAYLSYLPLTILCVLVLLAVGLAGLEWRQRLTARQGVIVYASLLAGLSYWALTGPTPAPSITQSAESAIEFTGTIVQPVRHGPHRSVFVLRMERTAIGTRPVSTVRVTWRFPDQDFVRGDRVALRARLHEPSGTLNPEGFDYGAHLRRGGIEAVASITGPGAVRLLVEQPASPWAAWRVIDEWREWIRRAATMTLADPALGVYLGVITGESGYITPAVRDEFMATGTVHILSISGSHLGLIALLSFWVVKGACRTLPSALLLSLSRRITPTRLAVLVTIMPVAFYTVLAGAEVATVRSFIMIVLFLLTVWLGREQQLLLSLALAALLIVLHDPGALFAISFQLSFLSVLAIALVIRGRATTDRAGDSSLTGTLTRWLRDYLWISAGITLITLPLVAYYFNQIAWLGIVVNLVVVPFAGFVLVPLGLVSAIATLLIGSEALVGAEANQRLLDLFCTMVAQLARLPGAEWHVRSPVLASIAAYYLLLFLTWRAGRPRAAAFGAVFVAVVLCWWIWSPRVLDLDQLRVTFLDVGQGDAAVLELPDGQTVLIDGGAAYDSLDMGRTVVAPYLWDRGIRRLDHVVATHPQLDHVGGLASILEKFDVRQYWDNGVVRAEAFYQRLDLILQKRMVPRRVAAAGETITMGAGCRLVALNPPPQTDGSRQLVSVTSGTLLNNMSVVTRLDCGRLSFLFTADIERETIRRLTESRAFVLANVVKVPHHGARSSLDPDWVHTLLPAVAVISVGRHNPYGHPAADVIQAYASRGTQLLRTDEQGAIWFNATPDATMHMHRARDLILQPVQLGATMWGFEHGNLRRVMASWLGRF